MKTIDFYFDFLSPYAHLAFEALPQQLAGVSHRVAYKPILFAALLQKHGQRGPAEIDGKRDWTYRQVLWQAHAHGIRLDLPQAHPFNPLALLRLAMACGGREPNRQICETIFHHVWHGGAAADDAARLHALAQSLAPARDPQSDAVKADLRANTDAALALGLFGVPSFVVDDHVFWGFDALPMLRAFLDGDPWFDTAWSQAAKVTPGVRR